MDREGALLSVSEAGVTGLLPGDLPQDSVDGPVEQVFWSPQEDVRACCLEVVHELLLFGSEPAAHGLEFDVGDDLPDEEEVGVSAPVHSGVVVVPVADAEGVAAVFYGLLQRGLGHLVGHLRLRRGHRGTVQPR